MEISFKNQFQKYLFKSFTFKSLEDIWLTLIFSIIQLMCIQNAFVSIKKFTSQTWQPFPRPSIEIYTYMFCLSLSALLFPFFVWTGFFKIGSLANDNFKYGLDLDTSGILKKVMKKLNKKQSTLNRKYLNETEIQSNDKNQNKAGECNLESASFIDSSASSRLSTPYSNSSFSLSKIKAIFFRIKKFLTIENVWKNFLPVSSLLHLIASICILFPNVLLTAKEIEFGLRPKGFIHHCQSDFIFSRPLHRFSESSNTNPIKAQLISSLLDDIDEINYQPNISIELINYILALISFSLKFSSTLWNMNKTFSFIFSFHMFFYSSLSILTWSSFEILYKFESSFSSGIRLNNTQINYELPFLTKPLSLNFMFMSSSFLLLLTSIPIYSYAIFKYKCRVLKLKSYFSKFIQQQNDQEVLKRSNLLIRHSKNLDATSMPFLIINSKNESKILRNSFTSFSSSPRCSLASFENMSMSSFKSFKSHIFALLLLILICINSSFLFYDYICLYRLTTDNVPFWTVFAYAMFIAWYITLWCILTLKTSFDFQFSQLFKLNFWYFLNKLNSFALNKKAEQSDYFSARLDRKLSMPHLQTNQNQLLSASLTAQTLIAESNVASQTKSIIDEAIYDTGDLDLIEDMKLNFDNSCALDTYISFNMETKSKMKYSSSSPSIKNLALTNKLDADEPNGSAIAKDTLNDTEINSKDLFNQIDLLLDKQKQYLINNENLNDDISNLYENFKTESAPKQQMNKLSKKTIGTSNSNEQRLGPLLETPDPNNSVSIATNENGNNLLLIRTKLKNKLESTDLENSFNADKNPNSNYECLNTFDEKNSNKICTKTKQNVNQSIKSKTNSDVNLLSLSNKIIHQKKNSLNSLNNFRLNYDSSSSYRSNFVLLNNNRLLKDFSANLNNKTETNIPPNLIPIHLIKDQISNLESNHGNGNETDSGRHSMSDSPCSILPAADLSIRETASKINLMPGPQILVKPSNNSKDLYPLSLNKVNRFISPDKIKTLAGQFTSKCILSTGNSVNLISQNMQNVQPKHQISNTNLDPLNTNSEMNQCNFKEAEVSLNGCNSRKTSSNTSNFRKC